MKQLWLVAVVCIVISSCSPDTEFLLGIYRCVPGLPAERPGTTEISQQPTYSAPTPRWIWSFEESDGDTAYDSGPMKRHGILNNVIREPGAVGNAVRCTGASSGIDIPDTPDFGITGSLTIRAVFRIDGSTDTHGLIFFRGDSRPGLDPYFLTVYPGGMLRFQIHDEENNCSYVETIVETGRFVYAAAVLDVDARQMTLYVDGSIAASNTTELRPFASLHPDYNPMTGIGHHGGRTWNDYGFKGAIDEVALDDRAWSAGEVGADYSALMP